MFCPRLGQKVSAVIKFHQSTIRQSYSQILLVEDKIDIREYLDVTRQKLQSRFKVLNAKNIHPAKQLSKTINKLYHQSNWQQKNGENIYRSIHDLLVNNKLEDLRKVEYQDFKYLLQTIQKYHDMYYSKSNKLKVLCNSSNFTGKLLNKNRNDRSGEVRHNTKMQLQFLNLARDFFRIFYNDETCRNRLTIHDYNIMLQLESKNYKLTRVIDFIQMVDQNKVIGANNINYWNQKIKFITNAIPQLWRYSDDNETLKVIHRPKWKGALPRSLNLLSLSQLPKSPNLKTHINFILAFGVTGNVSDLKQHIQSTWGVNPAETTSQALIASDNELYPNMELLKAIVTSLSFNGQFLESLDYLCQFDECYSLHGSSNSVWEIVFRWAQLTKPNVKLLKDIALEEQAIASSKASNKSAAKKQSKTQAPVVSVPKVVDDFLLDNLFHSYLGSNFNYQTSILQLRSKHLFDEKRLKSLICELPVAYEYYSSNLQDPLAKQYYFNYLLMVLNCSFNEKNLINSTNPSEKSVVEEVAAQYNEQGPAFMYDQHLDEKLQVKNSYKNKAAVKNLEQFVGKSAQPIINTEILRLLEFYRLDNDKSMETIKTRFLELNALYRSNEKYFDSLKQENYSKQQEKFDEEEEEDNLW